MGFKHNFYTYLIFLAAFLASCGSSRKNRDSRQEVAGTGKSVGANAKKTFAAEYSKKLGVTVPESANQLLITNITEWIGAPYKYGGNDKKGVDCSGFIHIVYPQTYNIQVPRSSAQMYKQAKPVPRNSLKEGDIVFFKINTREVGHSGIYLFDNYFVHASTSRGVMISRLEDTYWNKYFVGGGRFSR